MCDHPNESYFHVVLFVFATFAKRNSSFLTGSEMVKVWNIYTFGNDFQVAVRLKLEFGVQTPI